MWKANPKLRELKHVSGTYLESLGGRRWILKEGIIPSEAELQKGMNCFFEKVAESGFKHINEKNDFSLAECVDRINFASSMNMGLEPYEVSNTIELDGEELVISFSQHPRNISAEDYQKWLKDQDQIPYWLFHIMRAAFNEKYMHAHDYEFKI